MLWIIIMIVIIVNYYSNAINSNNDNIQHILHAKFQAKWFTHTVTFLLPEVLWDRVVPTPVFLPGEFHGWRSLVGYSPWGHKESDTSEQLHFLSFYGSFWRRKWQLVPVFLPGEFHGWRSLVGYSPRGHKESDTTEQLHFHFLSYSLMS